MLNKKPTMTIVHIPPSAWLLIIIGCAVVITMMKTSKVAEAELKVQQLEQQVKHLKTGGVPRHQRTSPMNELEIAHKASLRNRDNLEKSNLCGCFYCSAVFHPLKIEKWTDDEQTAICPFCGMDSILPASVDANWVTKDFLSEMKKRWF